MTVIEVEFLNFRLAPSIDAQPVVTLSIWRVFEHMGHRQLVGVLDNGAVRMTSPVVDLDGQARTLTTTSGRVYSLTAPPIQDNLLRQLLEARVIHSGLIGAMDVSDLIWEPFKTAEH